MSGSTARPNRGLEGSNPPFADADAPAWAGTAADAVPDDAIPAAPAAGIAAGIATAA
ncbi:hypothetical protein GCM10010129_70200 [Streptomyces fumigatiscleroticus]|nr:hypothetical protein GCM10010129_70200 [Streptomyces fumigatiscleroticus]